MECDLFISHKTMDDDLVTRLATGLERAGIRCYVDHIQNDFTQWVDLAEFAENVPALLLLLTKNAYDDRGDNVLNEALPGEGSTRNIVVVHTPDVRYGQGRVGRHFKTYSWIEWDPDQGADDVAMKVKSKLRICSDESRLPAEPLPPTPPATVSEPTYTVHSKTPRVSVSLKRDASGYQNRKTVMVRRFGPASGDRWALTPQQFEEFARLAQSER